MNTTLKINESVSWTGIVDHDLVTFDVVMETKYGTTYNSYFIDADKKVVIDTVKETFKDDYLTKLGTLTDLTKIDYIVVNHTEPDHSGCVKHLLELSPNARVYGSRQAITYLSEMMGRPFDFCYVKDGDTLSLGNKTLRFISAPNLHWPDSIYTYLVEDKLLFTCDSFGAHFGHDAIFDDLIGDYSDAFQYYFDVILKPFSKFMLKAIEAIRPLDIAMICPGHGPILRTHWKAIVDKSEALAKQYLSEIECKGEKNVLIAYVSAYGYTKQIARTIADTLKQIKGLSVEMIDVEHILAGDLEEKITRCQALLIGSPTINQNTLPPIYKMFGLINPIRDRGKPAASFGSFGWSGEAVKLIEGQLRSLKLNVVVEGMAAKFYPDDNKKEEIRRFANRFAEQVLAVETAQAG